MRLGFVGMLLRSFALIAICSVQGEAQSTLPSLQPFSHVELSTGCYACHPPRTSTEQRSEWMGTAELTSSESTRCSSCHDGLIAEAVAEGQASLADHPVNVAYDPRAQDLFPVEFNGRVWVFRSNPVNEVTRLRLMPGADGRPTVRCESCHDPHGSSQNRFLRDGYVGSESKFCRTCHKGQSGISTMVQ